MKKSVLYLLSLAMLPMLVSCFSTMPSSSYVDELYGRMPSNNSGYYGDSSQSSQQYSSSATEYAESAAQEYYPGMIEESLTGSLSYEDDYSSDVASSYSTYSEPESTTTLVINVDAWSPAWYGAAWALSPIWRPSWYHSSWMNPYWGSSWYSPYWYSSWYSPYWGPSFGWYSWWGPSRPYYSHRHNYSPYYGSKYNRNNSVYGSARTPAMSGSSARSNSYLKTPVATRSASTATSGGTIQRNINQYNTRGSGSTATRSGGTSSGSSYSNPVRNSGSSNSGVTRSSSGSSNSGSSYNRSSSGTRSSGTTRSSSSSGSSGTTRSSGSSGSSAGGIRNR